MSRKTVPTALYTPAALHMVKQFRSLFMAKWPTSQMRNACTRFTGAEIAPDGEVIIPPPMYFEGPLWEKDYNDIFKWLAIHLKLAVKDNHPWYRGNDEVIEKLSTDTIKITVSDAYLVYDIWLGRKNVDQKFSKGQFTKMVGQRRDPITTELEIARRQQIKDINEQAAKDIEAARGEMYQKQSDFRKKSEEEFAARRAEIEKARDEKLKDLNKSMADITGISGEAESLAG